ncbi:zwei Ig domain protein zig-8-like isoform X2 [Mizuhopecten yessoensis]|uniref:zwei Ig domain protein zig-8-like isoform X2 n=1 Tax=Mizuhopecten yessoensis TaxID=6573 RepID=UPI000B459AAF|nr:zwei Ig domain protein zig-8-like isoform X2 [Mizuhopecten yessoensis]
MSDSTWRLLSTVVLILFVLLITVSAYSSKRRVLVPNFLPTKTNVTVHMGELAVLQCKIRNLGPKQVSWRKVSLDYPLTVGTLLFDNQEDLSVDHKKLRGMVTQYNLIIKRAQPRHSGKYECQISATNIHTHHVYLTVLDSPLHIEPAINIRGTEYVSRYEEIRLDCNATGAVRAPDDIDWFHNGHMIVKDDLRWRGRIRIHKYKPEVPGRSLISSLVIEYSLLSDGGRYVCRSSDLETVSMDVNVLNSEEMKLVRDAGKNRRDPNRKDTVSRSTSKMDRPNGTSSGSRTFSSTSILIILLTVCSLVTR